MSVMKTVFSKNIIKTALLSILLGLLVMVLSGWTMDVYAASRVPRMSGRRFGRELAKMVDEHDGYVTKEKAAKNPFLSSRLILKSASQTVNPSEYGAVDAIQDLNGHYILQFKTSKDARKAFKELKKEPSTVYVEPDRYLFPAASASQNNGAIVSWGVSATGSDKYAWYLNKLGKTGSVKIAVLDSGIRKTHELFTGRLLSSDSDHNYEQDFYDKDEDATDESGHGTQVAGIIAACTSDVQGIHIIPVRVLGRNKSGKEVTSFSICATAVEELAGFVDVMNLSFAMSTMMISELSDEQYTKCMYMEECIAAATHKGTVVVIAAGNSSGDTQNYAPSNILDEQAPGCIVVSACNQDRTPRASSNYGEAVDLSAPGTDIVTSSYQSDVSYKTNSGTSFAAPHVAAAAAMLKLNNPSLTPYQIEIMLENSSSPLSILSYQTGRNYGSGILSLSNLIPGEYIDAYEQYIVDKEAAESVMELISDLPTPVTLADKTAVEEAREACDALTADQKALVTNLNILTEAENTIAKLEEDKDAAQPVIDQISALPSSDDITLDDKAAVEAARAAYDALTANQKSMVDNADRLSAAETKLQELINAAEKEKEQKQTEFQNKYPRSDPKPNVTYRVPLKKKQNTKVLRVIGLADGDKVISWKSSNRKKAKVTGQENGTCLIKAGKKTGKVKITALTASGKKVVFKLRIQSGKVKTKKIRIAKRTVRISLGETFVLQPERYPVTSKQKITYKSRNESVAAVTKKGVIRGISEGTTKVVIYSGDCKLKVKVIVG